MRTVALLALLIPAAVFAEPDPGAPQPPADPVEPAPALEPSPVQAPTPPPVAAAPYATGVDPYGRPLALARPTGAALRKGFTFEANLGLGWIHYSSDAGSDTSDIGLAGADLGAGAFVSPRLAITGRIAGVSLTEKGVRLTSGVLVVAAQVWIDDHFWLGGGAGVGVLALSGDIPKNDSVTGLGLDFRAGYTFTTGNENTINLSLELTPTFLEDQGSKAKYTSIGILFGYQHL
ncbi:MAG: outer membrane beta-barrel protein [Myxococcales bacterium]|nr:outer membrane beta-barrel protein [Myxococcales bacterium]